MRPIRVWCFYVCVSMGIELIVLILIWIWDGFPVLSLYLFLRIYFVYVCWAYYREIQSEAVARKKYYGCEELEAVSSWIDLLAQYNPRERNNSIISETRSQTSITENQSSRVQENRNVILTVN